MLDGYTQVKPTHPRQFPHANTPAPTGYATHGRTFTGLPMGIPREHGVNIAVEIFYMVNNMWPFAGHGKAAPPLAFMVC